MVVGKTATTKREEGKKSRKESEEKEEVKVIAKRRSRGKWATLGLIE